MLERFKGEIGRALPKHLDGDRMARIALTSFRSNPKLAKCEPRSVFASIIVASQLGLEPGVMGQCYLIPYKDECQLQIGYQGLIELVRRSGKIKRVEAHVVHANDTFTYRTGMQTVLEHEPVLEGDPGEPRLAYAVAEFVSGGFHVEVMTKHQIEAIRDRSQNVQNAKKYGKKTPWDTDPEEMWRKTLVRRICKYLPKSAELATAIALENTSDRGAQQHIDIDDAIDGTWAPVEADDDAAVVVEMPKEKIAAATPAPAPAPTAAPESAPASQETETAAPTAGDTTPSAADQEPGIFGLSDAMDRLLMESARVAGVTREQLIAQYGRIDLSNYNGVRADLKSMAEGG
ncbi:recombinase RecT [Luteibacter yeojuensis]|uniref:Recombinase RecT n=2 Tax=Luteibacter yeojuensis TaxID=345309 RepID=A0A7X5TPF5_9GAMM|nr:recombinase RecT [Luteibacter yeojuensis]